MAAKDNEEPIPLAEETLVLDRRSVVTGRVRVRTETEVHTETRDLDLKTEEVEVTRVPIGREVAEPPQVRQEGDVTVVPVLKEVLVVEKRLVLTEELHIRRRIVLEKAEASVPLRKQRAVVERIPPDTDKS